MSDLPDPAVPKHRTSRWQVSLRTLFWLMAVVAVGLGLAINLRQNAMMEQRIQVMRPMARELVIDDPKKMAVVNLNDLWMDEDRWDVYLPPGRYQLCLATRQVGDNGLAPTFKAVPLAAGRHRLQLILHSKNEDWEIQMTADGSERIAVRETREWARSTSNGGADFDASTQLPADKPVVLYRRRYRVDAPGGQTLSAPGPTEGLLIWIEPVDDPSEAR